MKKTIVCLKCNEKLKPLISFNEGSKFIMKMKCSGCSAVFSMTGKSRADIMSRLLPIQRIMRQQLISRRAEKREDLLRMKDIQGLGATNVE